MSTTTYNIYLQKYNFFALTEVAGEGGPDLAPQKGRYSRFLPKTLSDFHYQKVVAEV